jgi:cobalt-precorrin-5B (C1)-methyltransferase
LDKTGYACIMKKKNLRTGYTTGTCAAAAAKAAAILLFRDMKNSKEPIDGFRLNDVEILLPDGKRVKFCINRLEIKTENSEPVASASVIKDAGDDPDITNGAEIVAKVRFIREHNLSGETLSQETLSQEAMSRETMSRETMSRDALIIKGGPGVGTVTKPGLALPVGDPAINHTPRKMIKDAVCEAWLQEKGNRQYDSDNTPPPLEVIISVPEGENLAKKTLNQRLGIIGGISILGTTGYVKPLSSEAWTATIAASMNVAEAMACREIVLSAGRASEKAHRAKYNFPEESYVMMGDHIEFSLREAARHEFLRVHMCAQWAKLLKIAARIPQTHVIYGAIDTQAALSLLNMLGADLPLDLSFNTAREILNFINSSHADKAPELYHKVCVAAKNYAEKIVQKIPVIAHLVSYGGDIVAASN